MREHPSEYALDRAALEAGAPDVAAHLARCPRCREAVASRRAPGEPPAWLAAVQVGPPRRARRRGWLLSVPALAAAAAAVLVLHLGTSREGAELRVKGDPTVTLFVNRGGAVAPWDGRSPVRAGDRLRLSVRAEGYDFLSVASLPAPLAEPEVLWAGPLEGPGETSPPLSFRVDARGSVEVLSVVLSRGPIPRSRHAGPPRGEDGTWSFRLVIPKEVER